MSLCKSCNKEKSIEIQTINEIINEIDLELLNDPYIDELGLIMSPPPPAVVVTQHKMGLSYKIMKPLFSFAIAEFNELIKKYKTLTKSKDCIKINLILYDRISSISRIVLLVRGDIPMVFNLRKELIQFNIIDVTNELLFLKMLFTKHPKSPSGWQHRKWCLMFKPPASSSLLDTKYNNNDNTDINFQKHLKSRLLTSEEIIIECELCKHMAEIYPKNYYAWCHRLWLLQFMNRIELEKEYDFTNTWLSTHVSDHSGGNHRQQVIILLLAINNNNNNILNNINIKSNINEEIFHNILFIKNSLELNKKMLFSRPGNDTLWYHRRGLATSFINLITSISCDSFTNIFSNQSKNNSNINEMKYINDIKESISLIRFYNDTDNGKERNNFGNENFNYLFSLINNDIDLNIFNNIMILILIEFIKLESNLACDCVNTIDVWNYEKQYLASLRYSCFLLNHLISKIIIFHIDRENKSNIKTKEILTIAVNILNDTNSINNDFKELDLLYTCMISLHELSSKLLIEDNCERLWKFINNITSNLVINLDKND